MVYKLFVLKMWYVFNVCNVLKNMWFIVSRKRCYLLIKFKVSYFYCFYKKFNFNLCLVIVFLILVEIVILIVLKKMMF